MEICGYLIVPSTILDNIVDKNTLKSEQAANDEKITELKLAINNTTQIQALKDKITVEDSEGNKTEISYDEDINVILQYEKLLAQKNALLPEYNRYLAYAGTYCVNVYQVNDIFGINDNGIESPSDISISDKGIKLEFKSGNKYNVDPTIKSAVMIEIQKWVDKYNEMEAIKSEMAKIQTAYDKAIALYGDAVSDIRAYNAQIETLEARQKVLAVVCKDTTDVTVKIDKNMYYVVGKRTSRTDVREYIFALTCRVIISDTTPVIDGQGGVSYERYSTVTRAIKMVCDENLDIISHDALETVAYSQVNISTDADNPSYKDVLLPIAADTFKGLSIVDLIDVNDIQYGILKQIIDTSIDEIKKVNLPDLDWPNIFKRKGGNYADIYLDPSFSQITNGRIETEQVIQTTGVDDTKYVWKGDYPLDRLIYTIQSNLDILMANQKIKGDVYGNLYATLMAQAIQSATVLEQARIQAYEQASQFQIKSMLEYYLGCITAKLNVVKALAELQTQFLQKSIAKAQVKLYNVQTNGFKSNNISKLFNAQLDGATTSFSAGMTETPPAVYGNAELMSLYTQVGSDMSLL